MSRFLFDVRNSNSKPNPLVTLLNNFQNPKKNSRAGLPLIIPLLSAV